MSKVILTIVLFALVTFAFVHAEQDDINEVVESDEVQIMPRISCQLGGEGACVIHCIHMGRKSGYCRSGICNCIR